MPLADYAAYFHSLGWLAALMLAALVPSLPELPWRRHAGWLVAFCAARLLVEAQELVWATAFGEWRVFGTVASGMLLWEFARRTWNDRGARISAATHVIAAECIALVIAILIAAGAGARPAWFAVVEFVFVALPILLGGASLLLLWRSAESRNPREIVALRVATVGFGLYGLGASVASIAAVGVVAPWFIVAGLGWICAALPATRSRASLACSAGVLVTCAVGPWVVADTLRTRDRAQQTSLLARAASAAAPLQGRLAAQLTDEPHSTGLQRALHEHVERLHRSDPLLHSASIWKTHGDRLALFAGLGTAAGFAHGAPITAEEKAQWQRVRPFVVAGAGAGSGAFATVQAPLRQAIFESPAAWLVLSYPQEYWDVQRQHARRTGGALVGIVAAFCAMGFVLASRQAIESAQRVAIERAQSADKAKTEFLAFLSHEMRTPLQTILGRTELLSTGGEATDASRRHGAAIETQGRLLLRLVTDLLDLGTLEAGKFQLRPHPFSLRHALTAVEDTIRAPAAAKQLALEIAVAPDVPDHLVGDETRLRQVLGNILGNAVKYTNAGTVTLRVTRDALVPSSQLSTLSSQLVERLRFDVSDTGPGLPPDKIPQLFTLFTRLDSGDTFTREGTGVGLALVRRLCELMGGTATAANRPEGGAEFTVRLAFPVDARGEIAPTIGTNEVSTGLHVLVAEDNAAARAFLVEALQALGHRVEEAADGPATLVTAAAQRFDAVLLDVNLPGMDGVTIARTLAAQPDRPRLIGCSAEAFAHTREAALAAGMDAFLEKPVSLAALGSALRLAAVPATPTATANLFDRLRAPELIAQTRAALARDLPATVTSLRAAHDAGDTAALRRHAHFLLSTALLAGDATLVQLCRRLEREADAGVNGTTSTILSELNRHAVQAAS